MEHFDVIIVGAGVSGVGAAAHLHAQCPDKRYVILEGRTSIGGTWDLFRYPGIRSDSDLHTFGYAFKPWRGEKAIADGPSILAYLKEAAAEHGVYGHIRFQHLTTRADWSSETARWTVEALRKDTCETVRFSCSMLLMCSGYYSYRHGHTPAFADIERFRGTIVHPQQWPKDLDYRGKRVVVIGSGATAVTLVPAMAPDAAHVIMLQRSPSYVMSLPARDWIANTLRKVLPERWAYAITRWKNVRLQRYIYRRSRTHPRALRQWLIGRVRAALGPDYDVDSHFTPRYDPWDQRLCFVPDGDLFAAIRSGKASVVTGRIDRFSERGVVLESGDELVADIVVTATGLELVMLGEMQFAVDGAAVDFAQTWSYKGMMYSGVPNLITTFGYINASWTLRADLIAEFSCRLLRHMDRIGAHTVTPCLRESDRDMPARPWIQAFSSGYVQRMMDRFPKQGDREPWVNCQDYQREKELIGRGALDDGALVFSAPARASATSDAPNAETLAEAD